MDSKDHPTPPRRQTAENGSDDGQSPLAAGTQIRQYKVTAPLQNSGSGRVYLALDLSSGERVVIKPVAADTAPSKNKPLEASILSRFHHPNAVRFDEMVEDASGRYLVFEYIEGMDLETFLQKVGPEIGESALRDLLRPVADALEALHGLGFIHRDLKPANLRIRDSGTPVLVDFDAAAPLQTPSPANHGRSVLTDGYAAPELYSSDLPEGPWSDVYGLAAIAYRAITGSPPTAAPARLAGNPLPPAVEVAAGRYSEGFLAAIDAGLALATQERPASAALWADRLGTGASAAAKEPAEDAPASATPSPTAASDDRIDLYPPTVEVRRRPLGQLRKPPDAAADVADPTARGAGGAWGRRIGALICLAAVIGAGYWFAWPYYLHNIKETWVVDPSGEGDSVTIAAALAAAKDGATIVVAAGTYVESLQITRPVRLLSAGGPGSNAVV
ncbi:MAG TPA: protein kinase, partial [Kiloniellaceae bacterium]|nr:protein kinase [Kiloniellaceae bacterium]